MADDIEAMKEIAKATQEVAKTTGKAIDAGRSLGGFLDRVFGRAIDFLMAKLPRSPYLNAKFKAAALEFGVALLSTASINHTGNKGSAREEALRQFFRNRLPKRFAVTEGEAIDLRGLTSPQMDLMFYDQNQGFKLNVETTSILPIESPYYNDTSVA